jgi:hypothetical protein
VTTGAGVGAVTVKVVVAEPTLPAASVAETTIVWLATERPLKAWPVVQAIAAAASSLQVVPVTEVVRSVAVKATEVLVEAELEPLAGAVIVTVGGAVSTVKVTLAVPVPLALVAETRTVWLPWLRPG